ncbi:MAG TPA: ACP phosphodiesterase [Steroidobacteraceae bacterium]|jgi:acyl carrier protein phosphodiesterase
MNWLAHVFLSEPSVEFRLGNLLADIVKGSAREGMNEDFLRGIRRHQAIDSFTDSHPVVRRSRARVESVQRRFSGIVVDVFYDYLLATSWDRYSSEPLASFTAAFYADIETARVVLPQEAQATVERMIRRDMLGSYTQVEAVRHALRRVSMRLAARWERPFELEVSVVDLQNHHDAFAADFAEFFPQLQAYVGQLGSDASRRGA